MQRWLPIGLFALGGAMLVVAIAGFLLDGDDSTTEAAAPTTRSSTTIAQEVSTTPAPASTSEAPTTTDAPTTTQTVTTSTTAPATTTSTRPDESVEEFATAFAAALASGDEVFVQSRLHPQVIAGFGEDLCRAWVTREIMALSDYELISTDAGPQDRSIAFPTGDQMVTDVFDATVSFVFQGQSFTDTTSYALVDHAMHWLGQCR